MTGRDHTAEPPGTKCTTQLLDRRSRRDAGSRKERTMTRLLTLLGCIALVVAASAQSAAHTVAATTVRMSVSSQGAQGNLPSWVEGISADGRWVVFSAGSAGLDAGDTNGRQDACVRDRRTGHPARSDR